MGAAGGCWTHKHQPAARAGLLPGAASLGSIPVPVIDDPDALRCKAGRVAGDGPDPPLVRLVQTADQHVLSARAQRKEIRALHHVGAGVCRLPDDVAVDQPEGLVRRVHRARVREVGEGVVLGLEEAELRAAARRQGGGFAAGLVAATDPDPPLVAALRVPVRSNARPSESWQQQTKPTVAVLTQTPGPDRGSRR